MRRMVVSIVVFVAALSFSTEKSECQVEQRIRNIENGLLEFQPGMIDSGQTRDKHTLSERMGDYKIPGVSIALINNNQIEWTKAYGFIREGSDTRVTTETLFEAASTTKLVVSAITLHFVEKGIFGLDDDVNEGLNSWKIPDGPFTKDHKVTLRLLLTHQSGFNRPDGGFDWEGVPTLVQTLRGEAPSKNKPAVLEFVPGAKWQYSNFGYLVIQALLEDVMGEPFQKIAEETMFGPAGMTSSTLVVPLNDELKKNEAVPHDADGKAHEPMMHPTAVANGGLMTTPSDLALFANELMRAYRGDSDRIMSRETARNMFHKELDLDPRLLGFPIGGGLGVLLVGEGRTFSFLHPGDNYPGSSCWLVGFPNLGKGAVIMTNGAKGNLLAMEIVSAIGDEYGWPAD